MINYQLNIPRLAPWGGGLEKLRCVGWGFRSGVGGIASCPLAPLLPPTGPVGRLTVFCPALLALQLVQHVARGGGSQGGLEMGVLCCETRPAGVGTEPAESMCYVGSIGGNERLGESSPVIGVWLGSSRRARAAGRVTGLMALPERASRRAGGWGAPSHHWAAVIVLVCLDALHIIPLGMYVCMFVSMCMRAPLVHVYACAVCAYVRLCRSDRRRNGRRSVDSAGLGLEDEQGDRRAWHSPQTMRALRLSKQLRVAGV